MSIPARPGQPNSPPERSGTLVEPGANFPSPQPGRPQPVERSGTLIETDDDIRQAFLSGQKGRQPGQLVAVDPPAPVPAAPQQPAARTAVPFRPTVRPPVDVLSLSESASPFRYVVARSSSLSLLALNESVVLSLSHNVGSNAEDVHRGRRVY